MTLMQAAEAVAGPQSIDLRLLVISADGTEAGLPAIEQTLRMLGTPYTLHIATARLGRLTRSFFARGAHGFYQGVILATGSLAYYDGMAYSSALSAREWQNLWRYEAAFGIRQVSWYTYPTAEYGFQPSESAVYPSSVPLQATFSPAGAALFVYANTACPIAIRYAYTYLARPLDGSATTPLLVDAQGHALGVVHTSEAGLQSLALTFDSNPNLTHTLVLAYGLINWVTQGLFLGERRVYLGPQIDDLYIEDDIWPAGTPCGTDVAATGATYRITGADLQCVVDWQRARQEEAITRQLRISMAYNGLGSTGTYDLPDTLTDAVDRVQSEFSWINHTYDHLNLDDASYEESAEQIEENNAVALAKGFAHFSPACMVTPDISGLTNPRFLQAAHDNGIRYLVTDTSRPGYDNPSPNAGIYNVYQPGILMVPRRPTNLYYNVSTPAEWLAEDHCLYPEGCHGHAASYEALLGRESEALVRYLLRGDGDPLMFHEANLRGYAAGRTLLTDLLGATLARYRALLTLPVESPPLAELGRRMAERMAYDAAGASGRLRRAAGGGGATVELRARGAAVVPVTGLAHPDAALYGGQPVARIPLAPGGRAVCSL